VPNFTDLDALRRRAEGGKHVMLEKPPGMSVAEVKALDLKGFTIIENNGLGQSVPHLHVHIIPRYGSVRLREIPLRIMPDAELEKVAVRIRAALAEMDAHGE